MAKTSSGSNESSRHSPKRRSLRRRVRPSARYYSDERWKGCVSVCFTREDAHAFSAALLAEFPGMRFVSERYWKPFVDWKAFDEAMNERQRREKAGLDPGPWRYRMRDPTGEPLHYWNSLGVPEENEFYGWIEPHGWQAQWGEEEHLGARPIVNHPRLELFFRRSRFRCLDRSPRAERVTFPDPPEPKNDTESITLETGQLLVKVSRFDPERQAFARKVLRILHKSSIDRFVSIEYRSRRALSSRIWRSRGEMIAGKSAEAWSLARRHNYLTPMAGMGLIKPASYPFAPADVFSPAELAAYEAKERVELGDAIAREKQRWREYSAEARRQAPAKAK